MWSSLSKDIAVIAVHATCCFSLCEYMCLMAYWGFGQMGKLYHSLSTPSISVPFSFPHFSPLLAFLLYPLLSYPSQFADPPMDRVCRGITPENFQKFSTQFGAFWCIWRRICGSSVSTFVKKLNFYVTR